MNIATLQLENLSRGTGHRHAPGTANFYGASESMRLQMSYLDWEDAGRPVYITITFGDDNA